MKLFHILHRELPALKRKRINTARGAGISGISYPKPCLPVKTVRLQQKARLRQQNKFPAAEGLQGMKGGSKRGIVRSTDFLD